MNQKQNIEQFLNIPEIFLIEFNFKNSSIEVREQLTFNDVFLRDFYEIIQGHCKEFAYISTCNRVSFYFTSSDYHKSADFIRCELARLVDKPLEQLETQMLNMYGSNAIRHLLSVISSLDSMVLGENEIFGQIKTAYKKCVKLGTTGLIINRLFHQAFSTGKRVRNETDICKNPLSIASIAVEKAVEAYGALKNKDILIVGSGEMADLLLKNIIKQGHDNTITIANRSKEKAEELLHSNNVKQYNVIHINELRSSDISYDLIFTSTSSRQYLLEYETIKNSALKNLIVCIDISVPRNINPNIKDHDSVLLFDIDDLREISNRNLERREGSISKVKEIIEQDIEEFLFWYSGLEMTPIIVKLQNKFDEVRIQELQKYKNKKLSHLSENDFQIIEELTRQIMIKTLHNPITALKKYQQRKPDSHVSLETIIEELFH